MMRKLIDAAKKGKWDFVDSEIPKTTRDLKIANWAINSGLGSSNANVRDLAASILEKSKVIKIKDIEERLYAVLLKDSNPYARYRSAFALANHGSKKYRGDILGTLREASKDPDISEIAKKYIKNYNS